MNAVIGFSFIIFAGIVFYAMQQGSILMASLICSLGLCPVGLVAAGITWHRMDEKQALINQRHKYLPAKLAFAWALESMAPEEYKPYIQYDAQSIYLRMEDDGILPNIKQVREMKNYYLNKEPVEHWDEYLRRVGKFYRLN